MTEKVPTPDQLERVKKLSRRLGVDAPQPKNRQQAAEIVVHLRRKLRDVLEAQPSPTVVTWCDQCGKAGIRKRRDELDVECRYCGGDVRRRTLPSRLEARKYRDMLWQQRRVLDAVKAETEGGAGPVSLSPREDAAKADAGGIA